MEGGDGVFSECLSEVGAEEFRFLTAEEKKRSFLQKNPEIPAYLSWLAPNFRLRVGDVRTRLEAEHLLGQVKAAYPGSYIVPDEIGMPRLE